MVFVAGELLLAMAIPFVAIQGYHTLLESRAGKFVEEPTRADPAWRALVESTAVLGFAEVDQGAVTGVTLVVSHPEAAGTIILVPGSLELDGKALSARLPEEAVAAVAATVSLSISSVGVLDETTWPKALGPAVYDLESPDPVQSDDGQPLFGVGPVAIDGALAAAFLGRPAPGVAPVSVHPRRHVFWNALLARPPTTNEPLAAQLNAMDATVSRVVDLPVTQLEPVAIPDLPAIETLIRDVVAFPAGVVPGDRLQVRILDRTGSADLEGIAAAVAANGVEVVEIGNAIEFDGGDSEVIAPVSLTLEDGTLPAELNDLARSVGATAINIDAELANETVVTVVVGTDFDLANFD